MSATNKKKERLFIHDLAGSLATALFALEDLTETMGNEPQVNPEDLKQLARAYQALEKMKVLIEERRNLLILQGDTQGENNEGN